MSARTTTKLLVALAAVAGATVLAAPTAGAMEEPGSLPEMCTGRSDPLTTLNAHSRGTPKYVLNLETDAVGAPTGVLVLGRSADRLYVDDFCRFWQHIPGQVGGGHGGGEADETVATAHAVGFGQLADGTRVLVRTDVRETDEGSFFRARYRPMGGHGDDGGHEQATALAQDEGEWVTVPAEGWAPLDLLNLR